MLRRAMLQFLAVLSLIPGRAQPAGQASVSSAAEPSSRTVDQRRAAEPDGRIEVEIISGHLVVRGGDDAEVHVTGVLGEGVDKLTFETSGKLTRISLEHPHLSRSIEADLTISVPRGSSLVAETVSADIEVNSLNGDVKLESVSGDVTLEGGPRSLEVETVSGDMQVARASHLSEGRFESVSGDINLEGTCKKDGWLRFETVSGDVVLQLGEGNGASFDISTFSGRIRGDADALLNRERFGPGASGRLIAGDGGARISIETFSGDLEIKGSKLRKE